MTTSSHIHLENHLSMYPHHTETLEKALLSHHGNDEQIHTLIGQNCPITDRINLLHIVTNNLSNNNLLFK